MKLKMYSIYDRALGVYLTPFPARGDVDALRQVKASFKDPSMADTPVMKNPSDFSLVCVGEFDDESGVISGYTSVPIIAKLDDLLYDSLGNQANSV